MHELREVLQVPEACRELALHLPAEVTPCQTLLVDVRKQVLHEAVVEVRQVILLGEKYFTEMHERPLE